MRSVEEQLAAITANAAMPAPVRIAISESLGLLCAEDVVAERPLPGFVQSAIDGYAVRAVDVRGESGETLAEFDEVTLPVVGEVSAGSHHPMRLQPKRRQRCACTPAPRCRRLPTPCCRWTGPTVASAASPRCAP